MKGLKLWGPTTNAFFMPPGGGGGGGAAGAGGVSTLHPGGPVAGIAQNGTVYYHQPPTVRGITGSGVPSKVVFLD